MRALLSIEVLATVRQVRLQLDVFFFFQAEDGIRDLVRSRGLGDVYKRQAQDRAVGARSDDARNARSDDARNARSDRPRSDHALSLIHI